ncbi:unnamed protein product, partial [marine sediment metagenome]
DHDMPRLLHVASGDLERLKLALALIFTARGVPRIYYGTEQGYSGGEDPENREIMTSWNQGHEIYRWIRKLCDIRNAHVALRRGVQHEMWCDDLVYAYSRVGDGEEVIAILNNSPDPQRRKIQLREESHIQRGEELTNLLGASDTVIVEPFSGKKAIEVLLKPKEAKVYARC